MFHPSVPKLMGFDGTPHEIRTIPHPSASGTVRVFDATTTERVEQINTVRRRIERLDASGAVTESHDFEFQLRYVFKPEMELLLRVAGYSRWEVRPMLESYRGSAMATAPVGDRPAREGDILVWTAWKGAS
jgi:hypothetical protein